MLHNLDCREYLKMPGPTHRCIFADVPDNIGLGYVDYADRMDTSAYLNFLDEVIELALRRSEIFWLSYNQKWDLAIKKVLLVDYRQIIWRYTFGQYNDNDFASGYRPMLLFKRGYVNLNFDAVRVESARQKLGDKRACGPRVPDDVWDFPRVVGNAKERRSWHPTQHPEALMERVIKLSCTEQETTSLKAERRVCGSICDLFAGSGTTPIVAKRLGVPWVACEISPFYCAMIESELKK